MALNASDGLRLKLDSISEIATSGESKTIYKFDYNNTYPLPSKKSYAVDFWGYYNGRTANSGLIPKLTSSILSGMVNISNMTDDAILDFYNKGNANRGTDPTYASSGMLNKITYPTGGYTTLNFESNTFSNWGSLSAAEIDMGNTNYYKNINVYDFKTCSNTAPKRSQLFCPDHNGLLTLMNVTNHIEIIRVTGGDPSREYNYYSKAYIRLMKKDINNNVSELQRWSIQNPVSFTPTTPYNMQYGKLEYQMNATDSCYMECSLGDDVPCSNGMPGNGSASSSFSIINDKATTTNNIYYGGGLRIASQESYDKNNIMTSKRNYTYSDNNDHTTGILMSPVRFHSFKRVINMDLATSYLLTGAYLFSISSNSYTPLSYAANGAVVGYNRVAVSDINLSNQNNGKTVYYYRNKPSIEGSADKGGVPDLPYEDNGLEDSICYYNRDSQMVRKTINSYGIISEQLSCGVCAMDTYVGEEYNQLNTNVINFVQQRFVLTFYPIQTRWYALQQAIDFSYFPAGSSNATIICKNQTYNTFGQCISQTIANSDGNSRKTQYIYPANDITSYPLTSSITAKYLYNNILQENVFKNENSLISQKTWGYIVTPTGNIKTQSLTQSYPGYSPYDIISEVKYDIRDNVIQSKQQEQYTVFLWSYNYQYPVAKIEGISYTDLTNNYYSQSLIDQLAQTALPTQSQINAIRTALTNANVMVTTYTYSPLIGAITATNSNGVTTNYTYDTFNRLYLTRNDDKNILARYRYAYQNNPDNGMGGYTILTGTVSVGASSYNLNSNGSASISVSGGSGSYSYNWSLLSGTTVLATGSNSSNFSFMCSPTGTLTVKCIVTDNNTGQTATVTQNITCTGVTTTYGNFTLESGYSNYYNSLSNNGTTVSFNLAFGVNGSAMNPGISYLVAGLPVGFRPSVTRTVTLNSGGGTWNITFNPNGTVYCQIVSGPSLPVGGGIGFNGSFNL